MFSFGKEGDPFRVLHDVAGNKFHFFPLEEEMPLQRLDFSVLDKDGGWYKGPIQDFSVFWEEEKIIIESSEVLEGKGHSYELLTSGETLELKAQLLGGEVVIPIAYGDGINFLGVGDETEKIATSPGNLLYFDSSKGHKNFVFTISSGGANLESLLCDADVTSEISECLPGELKNISYTSDNSCINSLPSDKLYSRCDYDLNGIIGFLEDIDSNLDILLYDSENIVDINDKFENKKNLSFRDNGILIDFEFDFDENPLDLTKIKIEKQEEEGFGYLIINGLNVEKRAYVDSILGNESICIKNMEIDSISEISEGCSKSNEHLVICDGKEYGDFRCVKENDKLKIFGLRNSGVREVIFQTNSLCVPYWSCTPWSDCVSGSQNRACTDLNNCGTNLGKPLEIDSCTIFTRQDLSCFDLGGEICSEGCSIAPVETNDGPCCLGVCISEEDSSELYFWIVVAVLTLAIIVMMTIIFLSLKNTTKKLGELS